MKSFNVIWQDYNTREFKPYNIIPYFIEEYNKIENKPHTYYEFYNFIKQKSLYTYCSRWEYEIIICSGSNTNMQEVWDVHKQIMMNINVVIEILMENVTDA